MGGPGNPPHDCPPCKIITDGRRLQAIGLLIAAIAKGGLAHAARFLAATAAAGVEAVIEGVRLERLDYYKVDEAHALSELQCHRAQLMEESVSEDCESLLPNHALTPALLMKWAREDRIRLTKIFGGEYHGGWEVNGTEGITKKP